MGLRRILVLVIASDFPRHYVEMQELWTNCINDRRIADRCINDRCVADRHVTTDVWFIKAKPPHLWLGDIVNDGPLSDIVELDREAMTIFVKGNETYIPGILNKTIEAIRAIGLTDYDFIWRTNLSSVLDFAGLAKYIDSLCVSSMFYGGFTGLSVDGSVSFASGAGFLMSRDVAIYLVDNRDLLRWDLIDDVAIGALLEPKFGITHIERCWVQTGNEDFAGLIASGIFHFRCETYKHERTTEFMKAVSKALFDRL